MDEFAVLRHNYWSDLRQAILSPHGSPVPDVDAIRTKYHDELTALYQQMVDLATEQTIWVGDNE